MRSCKCTQESGLGRLGRKKKKKRTQAGQFWARHGERATRSLLRLYRQWASSDQERRRWQGRTHTRYRGVHQWRRDTAGRCGRGRPILAATAIRTQSMAPACSPRQPRVQRRSLVFLSDGSRGAFAGFRLQLSVSSLVECRYRVGPLAQTRRAFCTVHGAAAGSDAGLLSRGSLRSRRGANGVVVNVIWLFPAAVAACMTALRRGRHRATHLFRVPAHVRPGVCVEAQLLFARHRPQAAQSIRMSRRLRWPETRTKTARPGADLLEDASGGET